jgi:hypothetical protein
MDLKQSEVFKAFSLMSQKAGSGNLPGIPMCSELLCSAEENSKFLCKSLEAEFTRSQGMRLMIPIVYSFYLD